MTNKEAIRQLEYLSVCSENHVTMAINSRDRQAIDMAIKALEQPEQPSEIQDILDYLDTALHPIISPEHWNVYSELHDMISTLPSAQPEEVTPHRNYKYLSDYWCECGWHLGKKGEVKYCSECGRKVNWDG